MKSKETNKILMIITILILRGMYYFLRWFLAKTMDINQFFRKSIFKSPLTFGLIIIILYIILWNFSEYIRYSIYLIPIYLLYISSRNISQGVNLKYDMWYSSLLYYFWSIFALYFLSKSSVIFTIIDYIFSLIGINTDPEFYMALISRGTKLIVYLLPFTLTFFYFSYREQKALAISYYGFWNKKMLSFITASLFSIISGKHLELILKSSKDINNDFFKYYDHIFLWFFLIVCSVIIGLAVIRDQMNSFNISYQIEKNIKKIKKALSYSHFLLFDKQFNECFGSQCRTIDSIYQLLFLAIEKNMTEEYENNLKEWIKIIDKINEEKIEIQIADVYFFKYFLSKPLILDIKKENKGFRKFYETILKNHITLISRNIKHNRIADAKEAVDLLIDLKMNLPLLDEYYYTVTMNELVYLAFNEGFEELILELFSNIFDSEDSKNFPILLPIYNRMLMNAIEKADNELLSKIIYLVTKKEFYSFREERDNDEKKTKIYNSNNNLVLGIIPNPLSNGRNNNSDLLNAKIYIIFLAAIKCIELSNHQQIGFIIKFLVTNFNGSILKKVYEKLHNNICNDLSYENAYYKSSGELSIEIKLNKKTMVYCFEKFSLLLYLQQRYVFQNKTSLDQEVMIRPFILINSLITNTPYINYLYKKLIYPKNKYGLIFFHDKDFMEEIEINFFREIITRV